MATIERSRRVPIGRQDYIAQEGQPCGSGQCEGCGGSPVVALERGSANNYCAECWSYMHGYDQAEEKFVRGIVGASVMAALDAGASEELVRVAVEDALSDPWGGVRLPLPPEKFEEDEG